MAINWTEFQSLSKTIEDAINQSIPQNTTDYVTYINTITVAMSNITEAETNYLNERSIVTSKQQVEKYTEALELLNIWYTRLKNLLTNSYNTYPLVES